MRVDVVQTRGDFDEIQTGHEKKRGGFDPNMWFDIDELFM